MSSEPLLAEDDIAIVGRAFRFPGAQTPDQLLALSKDGAKALVHARSRWGQLKETAAAPHDVFGAIHQGAGFGESPTQSDLVLQTAKAALADAGIIAGVGGLAKARMGACLGQLGFPTDGMVLEMARHWQVAERAPSEPDEVSPTEAPISRLKEQLGLAGPTFALDAACASSLYAVAYAAEALKRGDADCMLAGAIQQTDVLFLHVGFTALGALSPTGQSSPFSSSADGLIPGEGVGFVVLKRLKDAIAAGDDIHGVVRGVGLSNDGRAAGLLVPSRDGQSRAMTDALRRARCVPGDIQYIECHSTGTPTGDRTELDSIHQVYGDTPLLLGSLKANMGHLITAAGIAGLIRVLTCMRAGVVPPTPIKGSPNAALRAHTRVPLKAEPWPNAQVRRAAVSAFGFGGNNAHLIVEAYSGQPVGEAKKRGRSFKENELKTQRTTSKVPTSIDIPLKGLRFPPRDIEVCTAGARYALAESFVHQHTGSLDPKTSVLVVTECDPDSARHGVAARYGLIGVTPLTSADVLGSMPNMPANRISSLWDLQAPSHTVFVPRNTQSDPASQMLEYLSALLIDAGYCETVLAIAASFKDHVFFGNKIPSELGSWMIGDAKQSARAASERGTSDVMKTTVRRLWGVPKRTTQSPPTPIPTLKTTPSSARGTKIMSRTPIKLPVAPYLLDPRLQELRYTRSVESLPGQGSSQTFVPSASSNPATQTTAVSNAVVRAERHVEFGAPSSPLHVALQQVEAQHMRFVDTQERLHLEFLSVAQQMLQGVYSLDEQVAPFEVPTTPKSAQPVLSETDRGRTLDRSVPRSAVTTQPVQPHKTTAAPTKTTEAKKTARVHARRSPLGPTFDKKALAIHASEKISATFGADFGVLDNHAVVTRMPMDELLLCDRVVGIDAPRNELGKGTIWTESDVLPGSWYLHRGRMPGGVVIESGQADLFLISYMGVDRLHSGERSYRLLGCKLMYHRELPKPGETIHYQIAVDGHANHGAVRLFFFHYDAWIGDAPLLSVREGQAGYFTAAELKESAGILWRPENDTLTSGRADEPLVRCQKDNFSAAELDAFRAGDGFACFGPGFEKMASHTVTPNIGSGLLKMIDKVTTFDSKGGPWGRGYLKAETDLSGKEWFFPGHFKNDPCMPGTLMFEATLDTMAIYMAAVGATVDRDGYRFEPVPETEYHLLCRGQVNPDSRHLTYEVFVEELHLGKERVLFAHLLCTVDGLPAFYAKRMGLRLVPSDALGEGRIQFEPTSGMNSEAPLVASALGSFVTAFGSEFARFDSGDRAPRLPNPPYLMISKIDSVTTPKASMIYPATVKTEVTFSPDAWFLEGATQGEVPVAILSEMALQPCGWLATHTGCALAIPEEVFFRNLDGAMKLHRPLCAKDGALNVEASLDSVSRAANMTLVNFSVRGNSAGQAIFDLKTSFGFFPEDAFKSGSGVDEVVQGIGSQHSSVAELSTWVLRNGESAKNGVTAGSLTCLPSEISVAADPSSNRLLAACELPVDPYAWYFKAHFFQDPVQPGSIGLEALSQLAECAVHSVQGEHSVQGDPTNTERKSLSRQPTHSQDSSDYTWKYRGQVLPTDQTVQLVVDIKSSTDAHDWRGTGYLLVNGKAIYKVGGLRVCLNR